MDAHLFRRFCDALVPTLPGARLEKIHQPGPGVTVFALHGGPVRPGDQAAEESGVALRTGRRFLVLRADRKSPLLFLAAHRLPVNAHPPASVMRLRKYLSDHRIVDAAVRWTERRLFLEVAADDGPVWLCLDLREGPSLRFEPPAPAGPCVWPDPALSPLALCENGGWRDWPVLTPALRRTLPCLDPEEGRALLADLEAGGGDVFLYENREGRREVSAWPLPPAQLSRMGAESRTETVWEDPLRALALAGESQVYAAVAAAARQEAARPFSAEAGRLSRLLVKLDEEEKRLRAMCARGEDAVLLQACLYRFGPNEKRGSVTLEDFGDPGDRGEPGRAGEGGSPRVREVILDPRLTVRANMAAMFHQAARGRRGLEHLERRRAAVREQRDAAMASRLRSEAAPGGSGSVGGTRQEASGPGGRGPAPSGLPRQVQAFRSSDGFLLLRGRDTRGNALALRLAAPHDFWLHTANGPGAHVIIRRDHAGQEVPDRTLREAGALAALKSWLRDGERAEIQYALAKYVHPMKKAAPGMVRIDRSEGTFWTTLDPGLEDRLGLPSGDR